MSPSWGFNTSEIAVADPSLCAAACREIYEQRQRWRAHRLNNQPPFYTLGAASYLDLGFASRSLDDYLGDAGFLWHWAGDAVLTIIGRVRDELTAHLQKDVRFSPVLPAPGFHILIGAAIPKTDCARAVQDCRSSHFDMQYRYIPWERWYASIDRASPVSFTLPLKLPAAGGGLTLWESLSVEQLRADVASNRFPDMVSAANATSSTTIPYRVGSMVVHSGHLLHQMAGIAKRSVTDERITLQGHGIFADGAWCLYW